MTLTKPQEARGGIPEATHTGDGPRKSYVVRNEYGAFCSVCQSHLGMEEDDWDTCDACGGDDDDVFACYDPERDDPPASERRTG